VKVALTVARGDTRIEERPDPVCGPGDVVCRVRACATCGSDVGWYVDRKLPAVLGHEPVGQVVEVGAGVTTVAVGDVVAIHHHAPCGECRRCLHGHETLCEQFRSTALDPGGFAEYVRIAPELVGDLLPIGDDLDVATATLTEPLGCALRAQDRAGLRPGDSLLVVGAGCAGLLTIMAAHARGIDAVWVREPDRVRLGAAEDLGATAHGNEPVDVAMVCTESPRAIAEAAQALAPGGTLCLYAPPEPNTPLGVDGWTVFARELRVTASWSAGPADMRAALALLQAGAAPFPLVLTAPFRLDQTGEALEAQRSGEVYKAVVFP
jgi:L-iditol 2-dehydrogenase